jgi:hypothetical protein
LEDQGVGGKMGLEWILGRLAWGCGLDSTSSWQGPVAGCCECGDEPSGSCATELVSIFVLIVNIFMSVYFSSDFIMNNLYSTAARLFAKY